MVLLVLHVVLLDLGAQLSLEVNLRLDQRTVQQVGGESSDAGGEHRHAERHQERELALLALAFTPGKQVYTRHVSQNSAMRAHRLSAVPWHRAVPPAPWRARTASSDRAGRPSRQKFPRGWSSPPPRPGCWRSHRTPGSFPAARARSRTRGKTAASGSPAGSCH